jgi:hypothetical protein
MDFKLTSTEEILLEKMAYFAFIEKRTFSFKDFIFFEHNRKEYRFEHGTIRNIFSRLKEMGKIELVYNTGIAFYTLKGVDIGKSITPNHTEDSLSYKQRSLMQFLCSLPTDKPAIHDIHLKFPVKRIWPILLSSPSNLIINKDEKSNKDITIEEIPHDSCKIKTFVHLPNTVSVIVACTNNPIPIDFDGVLKLSTGLARAEERLRTMIMELIGNKIDIVPSHMSWHITLWHFGQDSLAQYSGKNFEMEWQDSLGVFRVYSKKTTKTK